MPLGKQREHGGCLCLTCMSRRRRDAHRAGSYDVSVFEAEPESGSGVRHDAERELAVLLAASQPLMARENLSDGDERLLCDLATALEFPAGALWLPQNDVLVARAIWGASSIDRAALASALRKLRVKKGVGLAGSAWEHRLPIDQARSTARELFPQRQGMMEGLRAVLGLPALTGAEVLGVIELYSPSRSEFSNRLMHVLTVAGYVLGTAIARRRGELHLAPLTARELEVLRLLAQGCVGREIAEHLQISPATVKTHLAHIYAKLGVVHGTAAVARGLRSGLLD